MLQVPVAAGVHLSALPHIGYCLVRLKPNQQRKFLCQHQSVEEKVNISKCLITVNQLRNARALNHADV